MNIARHLQKFLKKIIAMDMENSRKTTYRILKNQKPYA